MIELIQQPWAWYIAGPMISLTMFLLMWFGRKFGVSSTLRTTCAACGAGTRIPFFDFDWKNEMWNIAFVLGGLVGGFIAATWLSNPEASQISAATIADLQALGVEHGDKFVPESLFSWAGLWTLKGFVVMIIGGFLVGFGTRYAGGCTSGHAITGLSELQVPSLIAVIGFFIGGLLMTHVLLPFILQL